MDIDKPGIRSMRADRLAATTRRLRCALGIVAQRVGVRGTAMQLVVIPPGGRATPHAHVVGPESGVDVLQRRARTCRGAALQRVTVDRAGHFLFVPIGVPRGAIDVGAGERSPAGLARNASQAQDRVEPFFVKPAG